jgi:hypothetical protein
MILIIKGFFFLSPMCLSALRHALLCMGVLFASESVWGNSIMISEVFPNTDEDKNLEYVEVINTSCTSQGLS